MKKKLDKVISELALVFLVGHWMGQQLNPLLFKHGSISQAFILKKKMLFQASNLNIQKSKWEKC